MKKSPQPSEGELEILQILWEHQPASVGQVHEIIGEQKEVGYTTVLKQLQRLLDKGMVKRFKKGKVHYYSALRQEKEVQATLFNRLLKTAFKGSTSSLIMHALGGTHTSKEELEELEKWLREKKKEQ